METIFRQAATYNAWANGRLYAAAFKLDDADYRRDVGAFFASMHGTLNHILVGDRIWMRRLIGEGEAPTELDAILYEDKAALAEARAAEDRRIINYVAGLAGPALAGDHAYATTSGAAHTQALWQILTHFFNHQTHHRGQAHMILSVLTGAEPPSLDLLQMQRGAPSTDVASLAG